MTRVILWGWGIDTYCDTTTILKISKASHTVKCAGCKRIIPKGAYKLGRIMDFGSKYKEPVAICLSCRTKYIDNLKKTIKEILDSIEGYNTKFEQEKTKYVVQEL